MVTYASKNTFVLVGKETTFNTPVTANKGIGIIQTVTPDSTNNIINAFSIGNRQAEQSVAGSWDATILVSNLWQHGTLMELMFGQATDTETTTDFRHTYIDAGSLEMPDSGSSFTFQTNFDASTDITFTFAGCKVQSVSFTLENNGVFRMDSTIFGTSIATGTSVGTEVTSTLVPFGGFQGTLSTGVEDSEATIAQVRNFVVNFDQQIDPTRNKAIGSRINQDLIENQFQISGTFTLAFTSKTEFERFLGGSSQSSGTPTDTGMIFDINNGVALGSGRLDWHLKVKGGQYNLVSQPVEANAPIEHTFTFTARTIDDFYSTDNISSYF